MDMKADMNVISTLIPSFDKKDEVIEFVNKWMRSHAIALQKAKLRLIGMQDDED